MSGDVLARHGIGQGDRSMIDIVVVRVYLTEAEHKLAGVLKLLHDDSKVRGVTVFRGITGFGKSGKMHSSGLVDMSLDLPVVVEFFDEPEKVRGVITQLNRMIEPGHIVTWSAQMTE